jgi:hypothetical protein
VRLHPNTKNAALGGGRLPSVATIVRTIRGSADAVLFAIPALPASA